MRKNIKSIPSFDGGIGYMLMLGIGAESKEVEQNFTVKFKIPVVSPFGDVQWSFISNI